MVHADSFYIALEILLQKTFLIMSFVMEDAVSHARCNTYLGIRLTQQNKVHPA